MILRKGVDILELKKATLTDLDTIIAILKDGSNQLAESGVDQWQGDYPSRDQITYDINHGFAYLAQSDDNETVGAIAVVTPPDTSYDTMQGTWLNNSDSYIVIHRVAVHSNHAGHGYATQLFEAVINHVVSDHPEIKSIRIDTHADNKPMQHLINKMGFTKVGEIFGVYHPNDQSFVYEKLPHEANHQEQAS
ncbi:acetyltransferase [Secundilactobacillus odoratitofui DSM 19909 = JCM 15043]|uniref:Acetyltransferase n=1 Tax=Secundilactobacillus odoratitofui DSM 19909 = JCM 15043 TaxID=1423776 RepID=A0A0R1LZ44_9LACO|nr:acetyltransferase [Secundilactobacillus odoratitofui DSM 19909 = JCM 15043]